jgi:trimethylamine corrinoid protein
MLKMSDKIFAEAIEAIVNGEVEKATEVARRGLEEKIDPLELMTNGFIPGINKVGDLFGSGKLFIPGLVKSADAMEKATAVINAAIPQEQETVSAKIVIGTVEGDMHDIGKTIVVALFRANGFDVLDLGRDVPIDRFIDEAEKFGADIIGSSTLLVTQRWANRIGADAFAQDAGDGVKKVRQLLTT